MDRFQKKNLIRNCIFGGQGPPGGDDEDMARQAPQAEMDRFKIRV